ncbi:ScbA/BarX family gamma-butyrolactone biosynthesis protein [Streptomyces sp. NPDC001315]|uniref:ScbA/BarX family gamma-butyrolactone biosynthesis protein n=1 Tax=Streptomyces sp. NPDC001315 TaxID=3364562 RepID=UPI0036CBF357
MISERQPHVDTPLSTKESDSLPRATLMELVHRTVGRDAFPVGWTRMSEHDYAVTATLPHAHPFFAPVGDGCHDPLLIVETMRQTTMLVAHAGLGVPVGHPFLLTDLDFTCYPRHQSAGSAPMDVVVDVTCSEVNRRGKRIAGLRTDVVVRRGGRLIASGRGQITCTSPQVYRRLRGDRAFPTAPQPLPAAVAPQVVGRTHPGDVVLSPTDEELVWLLRVDTTHPTLFQRPNDHVPGMLLLEAARQAAGAITSPVPFIASAGAISYRRYAEFASPCWIRADIVGSDPSGATKVQVTGVQDDEVVFVADLSRSLTGR